MPEWLKGADCKSVAEGYGGSNPPLPTIELLESGSYGKHVILSIAKSLTPQEQILRCAQNDVSLAAGPSACPRSAGVAHLFGKEEVMGPNPIVGSIGFHFAESRDSAK